MSFSRHLFLVHALPTFFGPHHDLSSFSLLSPSLVSPVYWFAKLTPLSMLALSSAFSASSPFCSYALSVPRPITSSAPEGPSRTCTQRHTTEAQLKEADQGRKGLPAHTRDRHLHETSGAVVRLNPILRTESLQAAKIVSFACWESHIEKSKKVRTHLQSGGVSNALHHPVH